MASIEWCKKQNKGIRFTESNTIISDDYVRKADEALSVLATCPSKEWKAILAYYTCYDAIYALLQKAGIVCEIHDCTLKLLTYFDFSNEEVEFIQNLKIQRINAQYYVDREFHIGKQEKVKEFVLRCKQKLYDLDFELIKERIKKL